MTTRKISECINVRINVGNYQHIEIVKYAEEEIEYSTVEERMVKEDQLTRDLIASLSRSMKIVPEALGKGMAEAVQVEQSVKKAIPEWMKNSPAPNIAKKVEIQVSAAQEDKQAKEKAQVATTVLAEVTADIVKPVSLEGKDDDASDKPLFEESLEAGESKAVDAAVNAAVVETVSVPKNDKKEDDLFDDLF